jgi:hypothetical protein
MAGLPPELEDKLKDFYAQATSVIQNFVNPLNVMKPPAIIYHYTDDHGLRGILERGSLRFTNVFSLNDPSELRHGMSHAAEILASVASSGPPHCKFFADRFLDFVKHGLHQSAQFFTCSFSANGDELGQWRAYADDGHGFAIGFYAKNLESIHRRQAGGDFSSFPVTYDDALLRNLHGKLVSLAFPLLQSLPIGRVSPTVIADFMKELSALLSLHALEFSVLFKHPGYENEV